jgi:PAS domain S-box-containing protein
VTGAEGERVMPKARTQEAGNTAGLVEQLADGVFTVDRDWRITSFNRAAEEMTGFRRDQVLGRVCREVFQASICKHGCALQRAVASGHPVLMRSLYISNARGERMPISVSASVLRDERGELVGAIESFRDVSCVETAPTGVAVQRLPNMVGESPAMQGVYELTPCVAETDSTVLIEGESGTGKELVARAIHALSSRCDRPMVAVNCGALPDTLLESELFGHKAGAFTDARRDKPGRFEQAQGGTIFLDEIGDISPALQARLLRVLQERVVDPVGGTRPLKVDVRVIAATNRDLAALVEAGSFRRDLYYRINVIKITVPPLRERREDLPLLVDAFVARLNDSPARQIEGISPEVMEILLGYDYPGNVRECRTSSSTPRSSAGAGSSSPSTCPRGCGVCGRSARRGQIRSRRCSAASCSRRSSAIGATGARPPASSASTRRRSGGARKNWASSSPSRTAARRAARLEEGTGPAPWGGARARGRG